mmetsp:Transcript_80474/g.225824  ORF Transcript_80474/g.225824 Transcript_80474/m.225824 type:complete len:104 (+) Transcript_80474:83-394(+)
MGCFSSKATAQSCQCANGHVAIGSRVQTQWTRAEGGNDQWFPGTVKAVFADGTIKIQYDDGDKWTGSAMQAWLLQGMEGPPMGGAPINAMPVQGQIIQAQVVG